MSVVIGHPTGNPNSFNAALAYWNAGLLQTFCVPWIPTKKTLSRIDSIPQVRQAVRRLERRAFEPLFKARLTQNRLGEARRLASRWLNPGRETERSCSLQATRWLSGAMCRAIREPKVGAVFAYEDSALEVFENASLMGVNRILELPTCGIGHKQSLDRVIAERYPEWLPTDFTSRITSEQVAQKTAEIECANLVIVPSRFAVSSIHLSQQKARLEVTPYGVDTEFWIPDKTAVTRRDVLKVVFVGQISPAKGIPSLLEAWRRAKLPKAELRLIGNWGLSAGATRLFPDGVVWLGPLGPVDVLQQFQDADLMVFPSWYEGFGLVILEAMACGVPVICSRSSAGPEVLTDDSGWLYDPEDVGALANLLERAAAGRKHLRSMGQEARRRAEEFTWKSYRQNLVSITEPFCR